MSFEALACSRREYDDNLAYRLRESDLSVGGLVTAIFPTRQKEFAVKFPARIAGVGVPLNGYIEFAGLSSDLHKASSTLIVGMTDGLVTTGMTIYPIGPVGQGYFMGYEDSFDDDLELSGLKHLYEPVLSQLS